jgi:hypothetical protein
MNKIAKALALVCVGVLGLAVSASARPPWTITTTATTATTTTATTATTTTATTTTSAPAPASVTINSPLNYTATLAYKTETLSAGIVDSAPGVTCVIDWGDGTSSTVTPTLMSNGAYSCATTHWWTTPGTFVVTVTDVNVNGPAASRSDYLFVVS